MDRLDKIALAEENQFAATSPTLQESEVSGRVNLKLFHLKKVLHEQFSAQPTSRVIVFVRQRLYGIALVRILSADSADSEPSGIGQYGVGLFTGANARGDEGGITQRQQDDLVKEFRAGSKKILVSTSVAEEGVDVETCNLILRYCMLSAFCTLDLHLCSTLLEYVED